MIINISNSPEGYKRKIVTGDWGKRGETFFVDTMCHHYIDDNGQYGDLVTTQRIKSFSRVLEATQFRFVDPVDGMDAYRYTWTTTEMVPIPVEEQIPGGPTETEVVVPHEEFRRVDTDAVVALPMRQFEFFDNMITSGPIDIMALIEQFIMVEDTVHHSWDK